MLLRLISPSSLLSQQMTLPSISDRNLLLGYKEGFGHPPSLSSTMFLIQLIWNVQLHQNITPDTIDAAARSI